MGKRKDKLTSNIAWSTADKISVRGLDLPNEILGHMNLGDLAFLQLTGRKATPEESRVFNAIVITLVEHGITPSAIAERMTYLGAPESLQAAVAAGLCGQMYDMAKLSRHGSAEQERRHPPGIAGDPQDRLYRFAGHGRPDLGSAGCLSD